MNIWSDLISYNENTLMQAGVVDIEEICDEIIVYDDSLEWYNRTQATDQY